MRILRRPTPAVLAHPLVGALLLGLAFAWRNHKRLALVAGLVGVIAVASTALMRHLRLGTAARAAGHALWWALLVVVLVERGPIERLVIPDAASPPPAVEEELITLATAPEGLSEDIETAASSPPPNGLVEDWTEFRGPTGQGLVRSGNPPTRWGPDKNCLWKQAIPGCGWSSPVVVAERIYVTTGVPVPDSKTRDFWLEVLCLASSTGRILWEKQVFLQEGKTAPRPHPKNSHASPTPVVADGRVFVHFGPLGTACLDADGAILWRNTSLKYLPFHGSGGSPILTDKAVIFNCDGESDPCIAALDRATGRVLWKTERSVDAPRKFSFSTPLLITVRGRRHVISAGSGAVWAYDPDNGKELWRVRYGDGYSVVPRPVVGAGLLFVCTGFSPTSLLAIRPDGDGDVTDTHVIWKSSKAVPLTPSLLVAGKELYMISDGGLASCRDARTGRIHWEQRLRGAYSASPLLAAGNIYFLSESGTGTVLKAGPSFEAVATNTVAERTLASPAVAGNALFIRTQGALYCFVER